MTSSDSTPAVAVQDILDPNGGIVKVITGADLSEDTVSPETLLKGTTANDNTGAQIIGVYEGSSPSGHCLCFNIIFEEEDCFFLDFKEDSCFHLDFGEFIEIDPFDYYDGDYIVTPLDEDQILDTRQKAMRNDVTVLAVPYAEVDNPYGGVTVTIGM